MRRSTSGVEGWLVFATLGPVLATLLVQSFATMLTQQRLAHEALEAEAQALATLTARLARAGVEFDDQPLVEELLHQVERSASFDFAFVLAPAGGVSAYVGAPEVRGEMTTRFKDVPAGAAVALDGRVGAVAAVGEGGRLGRLVIGLRTTGADRALRSHLVFSGALSAAVTLVIVVVLRRLLRALGRRESAARDREMLRETGRLARVGGWQLWPEHGNFDLTDEARAVLGVHPMLAEGLLYQVAMEQHALAAAEDRGAFDLEVQVPGVDAHWVRVQGQAEVVDGRTARIFGAVQDVTEARTVREAALAASRAKSQFLANTSHEVRTPLNGIIGLSELALATPLTDEQRGYLEGINLSGKTMLAIVNDLLDIARIEAGKMTLEAVPLHLEDLVVGVARSIASAAHAKGVALSVAFPADLPLERVGDPLRVTQVVNNLLGNALKFTQAGEIEVRLAAGRTPDEVSLSVRDTGIGIAADRLDVIFEAFTQSDGSTTRRFGGTGLGLTITRQIAQLMGGSVTVQSELGVGSDFFVRLRLPLHGEPAPLGPPVETSVLVVDGRASSAQATAQLLRRVGLKALVAPDVSYVASTLENPPPDLRLALVDCTFEGADTLCAELEAHGLTPFVVVPFGAPGPGALVRTITRPLRSVEVRAALASSPRVGPPTPRPTPAERPLRVLLAEDNPINATVARKLVEGAGHQVTHVWDGMAAVAAVSAEEFDLVLMDLQMPECDGLEATRRIRAAKENLSRAVPIYAMTANASSSDEQQCREAGMDGFLTKPVNVGHLRRLLASLGRAS